MDRLDLQDLLESVPGVATDNHGNKAVYFQPPENYHMTYPAIVYKRSNIRNKHADNLVYLQTYSYQITVIDANPDSEIVKTVSLWPKIRHVQHFVSNGLNHDIFQYYT